MPADQRNSGTLRNRRLFKMKAEVQQLLTYATRAYKMSGADHELDKVAKLTIVMRELDAIRNSMTAKAPAHWRDLSPAKLSPEELHAARVRFETEQTHREIQNINNTRKTNQKIRDGLLSLGINPHAVPSREQLKERIENE